MSFVTLSPGTMLAPVPVVMVSCAGKTASPNIITIAWSGTICSHPPMISVSVRRERYSHTLISETGEFVVNLVDRKLLKSADYCGVKSGRDYDKFTACGLHPVQVKEMNYAPAIMEAPGYLACRVKSVIELGSHDMFLGEIIAAAMQDTLIDGKGRINLGKADLVAFSHGTYNALSEAIGYFGFSVSPQDVYKRRMRDLKCSDAVATNPIGKKQ